MTITDNYLCLVFFLWLFPTGAHHVDLRFATNEDPIWLQKVRRREIKIITKWLKQYYEDIANPSQ